MLSACAMAPHPLTVADMQKQAIADKALMFAKTAPVTRPLTMADAMARALKYNLDERTKMLERALALGQTDLDRWDLLPKVAASGGYVGRTDHATVTSVNSYTGAPALGYPYYSLDRDRLTADLGVSWNVLDFGVSYFNARENADRVLIAEEHRRKTIQNVLQQVRYDFWRAAAAQELAPAVKAALANAEKALADARRVEAANLKNPAETLRFEKTLLENIRQLELIDQQLSTAKVELAALINLPPGADFTLNVPGASAMTLPKFKMPLSRMEEVAFVNNPDIREQGYLARIAVDETRKAIVRLLPGISLSADRQWDSNSFLVDHQWYDASAQVSWNLISILSLPDRIDQAEANETVVKARRLALRMAILAQVHVSYLQFANAETQYRRANELYTVDRRLAKLTATRTANDAQSVLEEIGDQTSAIASALRRYQSYAQMQQALGHVYATLGEDMLPAGISTASSLQQVSRSVVKSLAAWDKGVVPVVDVAAAPPPGARRKAMETDLSPDVFALLKYRFLNGFDRPFPTGAAGK